MSQPRPIDAVSDHYRALATVNGRVQMPVWLVSRDDSEKTLGHDAIDLAKEKHRDRFLEYVDESHRPEVRALLMRLSAKVQEELARHRPRPAADDDAPLPPQFSEDALASAFTARHGDRFRYTAGWSRWQEWGNARWRNDSTLRVFSLTRDICREQAAQCEDEKIRTRIASKQTVAAVENLARADRIHAATVEQWDADHWILNTPDCVIDLRTGDRRANRPDDYCTKMTAVSPGGACPRWMTFLGEVTGRDKKLTAFLQRVAGYCLTGDISEHALFFLYGTGGNGKGVFLNTLTRILGDYAKTSSMETFTVSYTDRHPTELAMLRGARMVTAQETEEGRHWAETRIKALTGGDSIPARFMRADFFEFVPQFKLLFAGNHKPSLQSVDEAMRRRFHLIPFDKTIPKRKRDKQLAEKLCSEWPGILQWMIDGCLDWQRQRGLHPPPRVLKATGEYFEEEDAFHTWKDESCLVASTYETPVAALFGCWARWCEVRGERPGSIKAFSARLKTEGHKRIEIGHAKVRGFRGLMLNPATTGGARVG